MTATQTLTLSGKQSSTGQSLPPFVTSGRTRTAEPSHTSKKRKRNELGAANGGTMAPRTSVDHDGSPSEESAHSAQTDSAEVLSHAAARKRRKQGAKTANLEVAQDGVPPIPTQKNTSGVRRKDKSISTKRQNSVWVGNLSFQTTQANVKRFFQFVGEVTRIHMPMKSDGGNRGFAYVDLATPEAKAEAIKYSERDLDGRRLLIKDGDDFTGRPASTPAESTAENSVAVAAGPSTGLSRFSHKVLKRQKQPPAPTLFIGNLGFEATADSIRAMIEAHERVRKAKALARMKKQEPMSDEDSPSSPEESSEEQNEPSLVKVRIGTFEDSGNCKGFAFLDFRDIQLATAALIDPRNYSMDGRELKLEYAGADAVRRSGLHQKVVEHKPASKTDAASRTPETKSKVLGEDAIRDQVRNEITRPVSRRNGIPKQKASAGKHHRARPGAALASAPREQASIVPSQGKKIIF